MYRSRPTPPSRPVVALPREILESEAFANSDLCRAFAERGGIPLPMNPDTYQAVLKLAHSLLKSHRVAISAFLQELNTKVAQTPFGSASTKIDAQTKVEPSCGHEATITELVASNNALKTQVASLETVVTTLQSSLDSVHTKLDGLVGIIHSVKNGLDAGAPRPPTADALQHLHDDVTQFKEDTEAKLSTAGCIADPIRVKFQELEVLLKTNHEATNRALESHFKDLIKGFVALESQVQMKEQRTSQPPRNTDCDSESSSTRVKEPYDVVFKRVTDGLNTIQSQLNKCAIVLNRHELLPPGSCPVNPVNTVKKGLILYLKMAPDYSDDINEGSPEAAAIEAASALFESAMDAAEDLSNDLGNVLLFGLLTSDYDGFSKLANIAYHMVVMCLALLSPAEVQQFVSDIRICTPARGHGISSSGSDNGDKDRTAGDPHPKSSFSASADDAFSSVGTEESFDMVE